jgi:TonB family protein
MTASTQAPSRAPWRESAARGALDAQVAREGRPAWLVSLLLHAGLIVVLTGWALFAPKSPPTTAVFELVAVEQPKLRPLAPKTPEPPAEAPPESRPPPAPAPSPKSKPAPSKPEPKHTRPAPPDPNLPVRDVPAENQALSAVKANVPSDPRLAFWAARVQKQVEIQWNPPSGVDTPRGTKVVVAFVVSRDGGKPGAVEIIQPSGNPMLDDLARRAILRLENIPPIPESFPEDRLKVSYEFLYNGN